MYPVSVTAAFAMVEGNHDSETLCVESDVPKLGNGLAACPIKQFTDGALPGLPIGVTGQTLSTTKPPLPEDDLAKLQGCCPFRHQRARVIEVACLATSAPVQKSFRVSPAPSPGRDDPRQECPQLVDRF